MRFWVEEFMEEIQKVEIFYSSKYLEFQEEFEMLKETYMRKKYGKMKKIVKPLSSRIESNEHLGHAGFMITNHFDNLPMRETKEI